MVSNMDVADGQRLRTESALGRDRHSRIKGELQFPVLQWQTLRQAIDHLHPALGPPSRTQWLQADIVSQVCNILFGSQSELSQCS